MKECLGIVSTENVMLYGNGGQADEHRICTIEESSAMRILNIGKALDVEGILGLDPQVNL